MATLTSVTVTPANPFVLATQTQQFTATAHFSDAPDADVTTDPTTVWSSATLSVATISIIGLATALTISGSTVITASYGGFDGTAILRVGLANYSRIFEQLVEDVKVTETLLNAPHDPISKMSSSILSMFAGGVTLQNVTGTSGGPIGYTIAIGHPGDFTKSYICAQQQSIGQWAQLNSSGLATTTFGSQKNLGVVSSISVDSSGTQLSAGGNPVFVQIAGEAYVSTTDVTIVLGSFLGPDITGKVKAIPFNPASPTPILGYALENFSQTYTNMVLMRIQICGE